MISLLHPLIGCSCSAWEHRRFPCFPHSLSSQRERERERASTRPAVLQCLILLTSPSCLTSPALTGSMHATYLLLAKCLCALCSPGSGYHLHFREHAFRHHKVPAVQDDAPEYAIDYMASILAKNAPLSELAQVNSTPSQAPPPPNPPAEGPSERGNTPGEARETNRPNDAVLLGVFVACAVAGLLAFIAAGICWCRMRKEMKLTEKTDYPAYKQSPPPAYDKTSPGDKKLAQNAQMYHYQHQKQQMISMEKNKDELKHPDSAVTSDEENEDGDFTVYECPGLAPTGEMEVKNPLFDDSSLHNSAHHPH